MSSYVGLLALSVHGSVKIYVFKYEKKIAVYLFTDNRCVFDVDKLTMCLIRNI